MTARVLHCWEDGGGSTCMLLDGHEEPHEFTPDSEIYVRVAANSDPKDAP